MTEFSEANWKFTKDAHMAAREQVYPKLWPEATRLQFVDTTKATEDLKYAVDCIAAVSVRGFRAPLKFFIQERFREPDHVRWEDVTVTEWNTKSDLPSELHKIAAHYLVYGYYDRRSNTIVESIVVNVAQMLNGIASGVIKWTREERASKDQDFIGVSWESLLNNSAITYSTIHHSTAAETLTDYGKQYGKEACEKWGLPYRKGA
jgi:hypothetical protein